MRIQGSSHTSFSYTPRSPEQDGGNLMAGMQQGPEMYKGNFLTVIADGGAVGCIAKGIPPSDGPCPVIRRPGHSYFRAAERIAFPIGIEHDEWLILLVGKA